ncbi:MAG: response regulator [Oligoflexia bacterium]|nr:response regulator [Oligoflexia bacterium]
MKKTILIVDDDHINGKVFGKRLTKRGYTVELVHSGQECLDVIAQNSNYIILLDIVMPEMNGIEVLLKLRETYSSSELPIIMITAKDETEQIVECLEMGANDFIAKPVNIDIATARINATFNLLEMSERSIKAKQLSTVQSMVATYNHEINNPLTIALGCLRRDFEKLDEKKVKIAIDALNRIADITKKIEGLTKEGTEIEETTYVDSSKMMKLD